MVTPTSRTLQWLKKDGWTAAVVERWNPHARIRQDLFGFIDVVAVRPDNNGVLGIQATSGANLRARIKKASSNPKLETWLQCGNGLWFVGWRQLAVKKKDGSKSVVKRWKPKIVKASFCDQRLILLGEKP